MSHMHIVVGGQFGSEGKGAFTASLVSKLSEPNAHNSAPSPLLIRVAGPNAGHTAYQSGTKYTFRQLPVGCIRNRNSPIVLAQGSEIDPEVLEQEISLLEQTRIPIRGRLFVDENATVIEPSHRKTENDIGMEHGSTKKGIGAARADRLLRTASRVLDFYGPASDRFQICDTTELMRTYINHASSPPAVIEGTQGYGLGLHTRFYPHVTSSNTRANDFLAMTGLQPWEFHYITPWLVFRSHPIRIAGNSGPLQNETDWETIGRETEYTTVTKLPRRVGEWDRRLAMEAIRANGGEKNVKVAFQFADYLFNGSQYQKSENQKKMVEHRLESLFDTHRSMIHWVGDGPNSGWWVK